MRVLAASAVALIVGSTAQARECMILPYAVWISPTPVVMTENASGADMTFFDTWVQEEITIHLERHVVTRQDNGEKLSILSGTETVRFGSTTNEIEVKITDKPNESGSRVLGIETTILHDGFEPDSIRVSGLIMCGS